jgi:hypothetical protein
MHPPSDPPRTLLFRLEHEELMREAAYYRLAERVQTPGLIAGLRHVATSRLRALRLPLVAPALPRRSPPAPQAGALEV